MASFRALPLPALEGSGTAEQVSSSRRGGSTGGSGQAGLHSWWDLPHARSRRGGGSPGDSAPGAGSPTAAVELCNSEPAGRGSGGLWGLLGGGRRRRQQGRGLASPVCRIEMPQLAPAWAPRIQMFLPSFRCSGWLGCVLAAFCCLCDGCDSIGARSALQQFASGYAVQACDSI